MVSCTSVLLKITLGALVLVALAGTGSAGQKLTDCCKTVSTKEIKEPILDFMIQQKNLPCIQAVIFQTASGLYCSTLKAKWVVRKIRQFRERERRAKSLLAPPSVSTSSLSLLSLITSPPSSSTSGRPAEDTSARRISSSPSQLPTKRKEEK